MEYKDYGHWSEDGKEFIITERKTPRNWYNYMFNDYYVGFVSQVGVGDGFCQDKYTKRLGLITDRCLYVVDKSTGKWHTACGLPIYEKYDHYECRHGLGYTTYVYEKDGIKGEWTVFVPLNGNHEQWIATVTNKSDKTAELGVIAYCATAVDGMYGKQGYNTMEGHFDSASEAVYHRFSTNFGDKRNGIGYSYMISDAPVLAYDCRHTAFIGTYGNKSQPEALVEHGGCTDSDCTVEKLCFAMENTVKLMPNESKTVCYTVGYAEQKEHIIDMRKTLVSGVPQRALSEVIQRREAECGGVTVHTPDERLNNAFNSFYKYATVLGAHWARVRHNGYRDMTIDTECLSAFNPTLAWQKLKRVLAWQYSTGYCPRTIKDGRIQDNNFADCAVWPSITAYATVMELGDISLLKEEVPFNDGTTATVFEHLRRAVQYLYDFHGDNGLIKIWGGDWNDSMNWAGLKGKGVSIWLSIAWVRANKEFMLLAELLGEKDIVLKHKEMGEQMCRNIEAYGWDEDHYLAAINDDGIKIGAWESPAAKMWLNPQIWAVLAEVAPREKLLKVMEKVDEYLETPYGTLLNRPAYTECDTSIGNFTRQPEGTLLNESVYLQPMAWKLMAEAKLKRKDALQNTLRKLLPWDHTFADTQGEPYILYNFYASEKAGYRAGIPGQSWRTATSQCFVNAMIRYIYGLVPTMEGLVLDPCLPLDWKECSITKQFRGCTYEINFHQTSEAEGKIKISVNGEPISGNMLPYCDGMHYSVDVIC